MSELHASEHLRRISAADDPHLSFKALGLLYYILSLPKNSRVNVAQIKTAHIDGRMAITTGLKELEDCHYLTRVPMRGDEGMAGWAWYVSGDPNSPEMVAP